MVVFKPNKNKDILSYGTLYLQGSDINFIYNFLDSEEVYEILEDDYIELIDNVMQILDNSNDKQNKLNEIFKLEISKERPKDLKLLGLVSRLINCKMLYTPEVLKNLSDKELLEELIIYSNKKDNLSEYKKTNLKLVENLRRLEQQTKGKIKI